MKTPKILFAAVSIMVSAIVFAACTQLENPMKSDVPVSLSYSTVEAAETKAAQNLNEGTFASGESVKVRISNTGVGEWTDYTFTTGSAGALSPASTVPYYPAGEQNIDIVAYYPATAGASFSVAADQTTDANYKASDLMFASVTNQAKQEAAVALAFTHKMVKLKVNITAGSGVSSITSVSILNVKPTVTFDQATGAVGSASGDATTIAMSNNGAAVIPAQTINGNLLSIVTDKGTATYSVADKAFAAGRLYTLNITVNLRAVGATTEISGWTSEGTVTVNPVVTSKTPAGLEAVDLGHPNIKWANMNVGAEDVTDYGTYFAWGETTGYTVVGHTTTAAAGNVKTTYDWPNYALCKGTPYTMNKYCNNESFGYVDNKTELERVHDAASVNWGGTWRMPTVAEWTWLKNNCDWSWQVDYNGVMGILARSKIDGFTDKTIFLPISGHRSNTSFSGTTFGRYWTSSLSIYTSNCAQGVDLSSGDLCAMSDSERRLGFCVRAVTE